MVIYFSFSLKTFMSIAGEAAEAGAGEEEKQEKKRNTDWQFELNDEGEQVIKVRNNQKGMNALMRQSSMILQLLIFIVKNLLSEDNFALTLTNHPELLTSPNPDFFFFSNFPNPEPWTLNFFFSNSPEPRTPNYERISYLSTFSIILIFLISKVYFRDSLAVYLETKFLLKKVYFCDSLIKIRSLFRNEVFIKKFIFVIIHNNTNEYSRKRSFPFLLTTSSITEETPTPNSSRNERPPKRHDQAKKQHPQP